MTFEQPAELDRYLCTSQESEALSQFWHEVKIISPMLFFMGLLMMETRWLKGLPVVEGVVGYLLLIAMLLLIRWYEIRKEDRSKPKLSIHEDGLSLSRVPAPRILWKRLQCFRVEPCSPHGEFKKFTVRYARPGMSRSRRWSMIFADVTDCATLLGELGKRRTGRDRKWTIEILRSPVTPPREMIPLVPLWLHMLGILFLLHGLAILLACVTPAEKSHPAALDELSPPVRAFVQRFPRDVDPDQFFTVTGAALTAIGVAIFCAAEIRLRRWHKILDAKEAEDVRKKLVAADDTMNIK